MDMEKIKQAGIAAAFASGRILRSKFGNISSIVKKGPIDLVTEADTESERAVIETLRNCYPDHAILTEETGQHPGEEENLWIIDPLDGTTNFAHALPVFSTSIAFSRNGEAVMGVVHNPVMGELFTAVKGEGAFLNGKKIRVAEKTEMTDCLLVTGFPYNFRECASGIIERFERCLAAAQGVRRLGSAAIDLCYVACGRFDGYWEQNLKPWDTAAGQLIAREAGAEVTDFSGRPFDPWMAEIAVGNPAVHRELLALLKV
jgi:myo-inositol-1(or 4)-monophosphatase